MKIICQVSFDTSHKTSASSHLKSSSFVIVILISQRIPTGKGQLIIFFNTNQVIRCLSNSLLIYC